MTLRELRTNMSARELSEWEAYFTDDVRREEEERLERIRANAFKLASLTGGNRNRQS